MHKTPTYCKEPGTFASTKKKSCPTYKMKKEGVVVGQDNGRLPGPLGRV